MNSNDAVQALVGMHRHVEDVGNKLVALMDSTAKEYTEGMEDVRRVRAAVKAEIDAFRARHAERVRRMQEAADTVEKLAAALDSVVGGSVDD